MATANVTTLRTELGIHDPQLWNQIRKNAKGIFKGRCGDKKSWSRVPIADQTLAIREVIFLQKVFEN